MVCDHQSVVSPPPPPFCCWLYTEDQSDHKQSKNTFYYRNHHHSTIPYHPRGWMYLEGCTRPIKWFSTESRHGRATWLRTGFMVLSYILYKKVMIRIQNSSGIYRMRMHLRNTWPSLWALFYALGGSTAYVPYRGGISSWKTAFSTHSHNLWLCRTWMMLVLYRHS